MPMSSSDLNDVEKHLASQYVLVRTSTLLAVLTVGGLTTVGSAWLAGRNAINDAVVKSARDGIVQFYDNLKDHKSLPEGTSIAGDQIVTYERGSIEVATGVAGNIDFSQKPPMSVWTLVCCIGDNVRVCTVLKRADGYVLHCNDSVDVLGGNLRIRDETSESEKAPHGHISVFHNADDKGNPKRLMIYYSVTRLYVP